MHRRRWYDQEITCTRILGHIESMTQPECREFCARVIIHFAEKLRKDIHKRGKLTLNVSSIGATAISGLYNFGHEKRRWYDQDPTLHKAVGLLYGLPMEGLSAVGFKLGDTMGLIQVYSAVCSQIYQSPNIKVLTQICTTALQAGRQEAEDILISIVGQELYDSVNNDFRIDLS